MKNKVAKNHTVMLNCYISIEEYKSLKPGDFIKCYDGSIKEITYVDDYGPHVKSQILSYDRKLIVQIIKGEENDKF